MSDDTRIIADIAIKMAETQLAIAESALGEQRHKTAKAEAEARVASLMADWTEKALRELGPEKMAFPKFGGH